MKTTLPDILAFEENIFKTRRVLKKVLCFSLDLMGARQTALLYGTNATRQMFLPPAQWDRGVVHKFENRGVSGQFYNLFNRLFLRFGEFSHVKLYKRDDFGQLQDNDGIIVYGLKRFVDFYKNGIRVVVIHGINEAFSRNDTTVFSDLPVLSFNGKTFNHLTGLRVNREIVKKFRAENFIVAYVPDYGALVINTADPELLESKETGFSHDNELKKRLRILIRAIEMASIAYLGVAKGQMAARLLWRKEEYLRKTAAELEKQKSYLKAVGGVSEKQLAMEPVITDQGVYAFVDMVGSARIRQCYSPGDYFFITNVCRQIVANIAAFYSCRVGNFIGDALFFQNAPVFDDEGLDYVPDVYERTMLMVLALVTMFRELDQLVRGRHPIDRGSRVSRLLDHWNRKILFRTGIETGTATIGPIGSEKRMMITAIGEAVDNAARLEATGQPNAIHMSQNVMRVLQTADISKKTRLLYDLVTQRFSCLNNMYETESRMLENNGTVRFFDFYKSGFLFCGDIVKVNRNVRLKEFSQERTYYLEWDRKRGPEASVCFGI
ncbi:MAG: adenylate/guanylate cyclase domain-containing protein [Desulfobacteraceae bacterium]